jgi:hypothetical protein
VRKWHQQRNLPCADPKHHRKRKREAMASAEKYLRYDSEHHRKRKHEAMASAE